MGVVCRACPHGPGPRELGSLDRIGRCAGVEDATADHVWYRAYRAILDPVDLAVRTGGRATKDTILEGRE